MLVGGHAPIPNGYGAPQTTPGGFSNGFRDPSFEIFSPPYLFWGPRPTITRAPHLVRYGSTITIGPQDEGKSIVLGAGDILVFIVSNASLSSNASPSSNGLVWRLVSYPQDLLTLLSRSATPPFQFRALYQGSGLLRFSFGPSCGGPGPPLASRDCPLMGGGAGVATRLLTFRLKVLARGQ